MDRDEIRKFENMLNSFFEKIKVHEYDPTLDKGPIIELVKDKSGRYVPINELPGIDTYV